MKTLEQQQIKNKALFESLTSFGARFSVKGADLITRFPLRSLMALSANAHKTMTLLSIKNSCTFIEKLQGIERNSFCGGSFDDLLNQFAQGIDLTDHKRKLAQFEKGDAARNLRASVDQFKPKRKPRLNDSEGSWDYARRFDDKPFLDFPKQRQTQKVVELFVNFSISSAASASAINAFGAYVWSINKLIEGAGIQTRIIVAMSVDEVYYSGPFRSGSFEVIVKESGEYLSPALLAQAFTANFYRRSIFAGHCLAADVIGASCAGTLGRPRHFPSVEFADGRLIISASAAEGSNAALLEELTKIFNPSQKNKGA
jgi:hypothetical protein